MTEFNLGETTFGWSLLMERGEKRPKSSKSLSRRVELIWRLSDGVQDSHGELPHSSGRINGRK